MIAFLGTGLHLQPVGTTDI